MTKVILIGTGTPNPDPYRMGPCVAVVFNQKMYLFDAGTGLVRRINQISKLCGVQVNTLEEIFITHLHSDHTLGLSDLILTPWVLGREHALNLYGPKGLQDMVTHLKAAYSIDIHERIHGLEKANSHGIHCKVEEIHPGLIYDGEIQVIAFPVNHGHFEAYGYKIITPDKTIVISGDTAPCESLLQAAKDCDILVHEVYYTQGLKTRTPKWRTYHSSVHTSAVELGRIASQVQPGKLVLYHQLFMQEFFLEEEMADNDRHFKEAILSEINMAYNGNIVYGQDLMIIE